ncbi:putative tail protein [Brevundimonas phage vB_BpoS-Kabachok]|uniref:Tail protein n=1 Tax=Brevundimonas phage vB_BpoS-Kabachok TaxID=2948600 RepID=A0A9E7MQY8_9CAUD|nr:putative tail protein [Brevundimonas phage vB_BpoS-Kabachok]
MTDYTPILHLPQVAANQEQKEATINTAIAILEAAMNDTLSVSLAAGDVTLNTDQFTKYFLLQFAGHTAARTVTVPATPRWFAIENQGTASVVVKVAGTGLSAELPANRIGLVVSDGNDVRFVVPDPISGMGLLRDLSDVSGLPTDGQLLRYSAATNTWNPWTLAMSFAQLTDTPSTLAGNAGSLVAVNAAGTRLEFVSSAANVNSFVDLDDTPNSYTGAANRHVVVNANGTGLTYATPYLRENSDFPNSYAGQAGKYLLVNATNNGVQFGMPKVADLTDGPGAPDFGDALTYLRVNAAGTGWEYAPGTGGPVNFTELLDTPNSFTGQAGRMARVGPDEDRLIFGSLRLTELSDTPNVYTDAAGMVLRVNSAQSGMVFGRLKLADLSDGPGAMAAASALRYLRVNANGTALEYVRPSITEMVGVASMAGAGGRFVRVNGNEDGFEYVLNAVDVAFIGLTDTPANYQNAQNKFVAVNPAGTGLIFVPAPSGGGGGATTLDQLTDVTIVDPAPGEVLTYRDGVWGSEPVPATGGGATRLEELTDVLYETPAPTEDYVLTYKGGFWTPQPSVAAAIPQSLDDLTDVDFSAGTPLNGDLLTYWDGSWIYAPAQPIAGEGLRFGEHRDWRLYFRTSTDQVMEITEVVMRAGAGLPQLAEGGIPTSNAETMPDWAADKAFDADPATYWRAPAVAADKAWLRYTFIDPVEVNAITLTPASLRQLPVSWDVQFSDDAGVTWITAWSEERSFGWTAAEVMETVPTRAKLSFAQLSDSPGAMTSHAGKIVRVNEDGTKLEYVPFTPPASTLGELSDVNMNPAPVNGQVLTYTDGEWSAKDATGDTELALNDLTDADTTGQQDGDLLGRRAGKWVPLASPGDYGRHAYWRVVVDDTAAYPGTTTVVVAEVVMRGVPGGPQMATGGTAIGTGGNTNGAFDGTTGDIWTAYLPDAWIGYHFAAPVSLQEITLTASSVAGWAPNYSPEVFRVQYSDDGASWFEAWGATNQTGWTASQTRVYTRPGLTTSFLDDADTPDTYVGQGGKQVQVKADASGLEFVTPPTVPQVLNDLTDVEFDTPPTAGQLLTFKDGVWQAENPTAVPLTLNDLDDVDLTEPSPVFGEVLTYVNVPDVGGVWRSRRMRLSMLDDVRQPPYPSNGQVLTWIDTGVEGSGYWEARTPDGGTGPGGEYPIYIYDGRRIESGSGAPDWGEASGSLYMRHDPGDLYVSRATPRLAPKFEQSWGFVSPNAGPLTWNYEQIQTDNWLVLFYAAGTAGPVTLDSIWTVVDSAPGTDINVTVAYRKIDGSEAHPLPITAAASPEDAFAVHEVSGLGAAWGDFYQTAFMAGSASGAFSAAAYTAPATSPYTFAIGAMFEKGGTTAGSLSGEYGLTTVTDSDAAQAMAVAGAGAFTPSSDATLTASLGAGSPLWAYAVIYFDAEHLYGENLEPTWKRFLTEGEGGAQNLAQLDDVDFSAGAPQAGDRLTYRGGAWTSESSKPTYGAHKDWRLVYYATTAGQFITAREVVMCAAIGGPQLAVGGTATASTTWLSNNAANAFDNNPATYWQNGSGANEGSWLRYAFAAPVAVGHVTLTPHTARTTPTTIAVQYSDDNGTTWTTAWTTVQPPWTAGAVLELAPSLSTELFARLGDGPGPMSAQPGKAVRVNATGTALEYVSPVQQLDDLTDVDLTVTGTPPEHVLTYQGGAWKAAPVGIKPMLSFGAHARWRILYHTAVADYITVRDVVMTKVAGGPQLATGGTASASSSRGSTWSADKAFDADPATAWQSTFNASEGSWLRYDFVEPVEIGYVAMTTSSTRTGAISWDVQYSDDGTTWTTAYSGGTANGWAAVTTFNIGSTDRIAFNRLIDTPDTYTGHGGKVVGVREDGQGLEFLPFGGTSVPQHRGEFGVASDYVTYDFEATPPALFANAYSAGWAVVAQEDAPYTKVLKSPVIPHNGATEFTFTVEADAAHPDLVIRYRVQSESTASDVFRVFVDGTQVLSDGGPANPFKTFTTTLSPGTHAIRLRYSKDGNFVGGSDDVRISYIRCNTVFSTRPYLSGDTVYHDGVLYLCLLEGTTETPGTGDEWRALPVVLDELTDVDFASAPLADQVLTYKDGVWGAHNLPASSGGVPALGELTDVNLGAPAQGEVLTYRDGEWTSEPSRDARLFLDQAQIGSGSGVPTAAKPASSLYVDESTGKIYQQGVPLAAPEIVQQALIGVYSTATAFVPSVTLPATPQAGNWLIALMSDQTTPTANTGWTMLPGAPATGDRIRPAIAYRQVSGDTASLSPFVTASSPSVIAAGALAVYEIAGLTSGIDGIVAVSWASDPTYTSAPSWTGAAMTSGAASALALSLYVGRESTTAATADAPWTQLAQGSLPSASANRSYATASAVVAPNTAISPDATFTSPTHAGYAAIMLSAAGAGDWARYNPGLALSELTNVKTGMTPADGHLLTFKNGMWESQAPQRQDLLTIAVSATTSYTLTLADRQGHRKIDSASPSVVTVPPNSAVAFPIGASVSLQRAGDGTVTVLAGSGVTLEYPDDVTTDLRKKHSVASLLKTDTDVWTLFGDLGSV